MFQGIYAKFTELVIKRPAIVAIVAGIVTVLLVSGYIKRKEAEAVFINTPSSVVTSNTSFKRGEMITSDMIGLSSIPFRFLEPARIASVEAAIGRIAAINMPSGTQLTQANTEAPQERQALSSVIPTGMRAITLGLDEAAGLDGLVRPNDTVDVIATFDLGAESSIKRTTMRIASGSLVVAVGRQVAGISMRADADKKESTLFGSGNSQLSTKSNTIITVAVTPVDAQRIVFARESGSISLALRSIEDDLDIEPETPPATTIGTITGGHDELILKKGFREYRGR